MSIEECPYFKEMGYCYDCPFYGDGEYTTFVKLTE